MARIPYDPAKPDLGNVRTILLNSMRGPAREGSRVLDIDVSGKRYEADVEYPPGNVAPQMLLVSIYEVFWQLVLEGLATPGYDLNHTDLPYYRLTEYGRRVVLNELNANPYDEAGYMAGLVGLGASPDPTVAAYVGEALTSFHRGTPVASRVMLGIAAERVFLLVCDSLHAALANPKESAKLGGFLDKTPMKPKLEWVRDKLRSLESSKPRPAGLPEGASSTVVSIYDLLRVQRNDLGHPSDRPPDPKRDEAFRSLLIFPGFYRAAEELMTFLKTNTV